MAPVVRVRTFLRTRPRCDKCDFGTFTPTALTRHQIRLHGRKRKSELRMADLSDGDENDGGDADNDNDVEFVDLVDDEGIQCDFCEDMSFSSKESHRHHLRK